VRSELSASLWNFRSEFVIVGLLSFLSNLLLLTPTLYMLQVYDRVMVSHSELTLLALSFITLFLFGVMALAEWLRTCVLVRAGIRFDAQLSTRVFHASFEARLNQSSSASARTMGDLTQVRQFLTGQGVFVLFDAPWSPIYIAVTFSLHPLLGVLALVFALVQAALAWFGQRHTVTPFEEASRASSDSSNYMQGKLRNAEVLESMGMLPPLLQRWRRLHAIGLGKQVEAEGVQHRVAAWSKFIRYSQQSLSLAAGALLVIDGQLSAGAMIASNVLMGRSLAPLDHLVGSWRSISGCKAAFQRLEQLLRAHPERQIAPMKEEPTGAIRLQQIVCTAPGRPQPILNNISVSVPAGTVMVVLGASASGKSTLARVMAGIWPDMTGQVLLDGRDLRDWSRDALGPQLGYLPQDVELFDGSIAENIARMGEVDSDKVIAAARSAGMHETILGFPLGYNTPIGEAGHLLSGGQRQRVALARALYGAPRLLVLDEPNANLDDVGEAALLRAVLECKAKGQTVILIAQRHSVLAVADRVLVLRKGEVFADGPKAEVLAVLKAAT